MASLFTFVTLLKNWLSLAWICTKKERARMKRREMNFADGAIGIWQEREKEIVCVN